MLKFCKEFQVLYGNQEVTPNMHLHCHLKDVIADYGPVHSFWCFSFERYNGIIGSIPSNNQSIKLQLMRKIITSRQLKQISLCETFSPFSPDDHVWENENDTTYSNLLHYFQIPDKMPLQAVDWNNLRASTLPSNYKESILDDDDLTS